MMTAPRNENPENTESSEQDITQNYPAKRPGSDDISIDRISETETASQNKAIAHPAPKTTLNQEESTIADAELLKIVDRTYGTPVKSYKSQALVDKLLSLGIVGLPAKFYPNGLPDIPEAKVLRTWHLSKKLDELDIAVDVTGDQSGALRTYQAFLTSDRGSVKPQAIKEVRILLEFLSDKIISDWAVKNLGTASTNELNGIRIELFSPSEYSVGFRISSGSTNASSASTPKNLPSARVEKWYQSPREWVDSTGKFRVRAAFVSMAFDVVKIRKEDGQVIEIDVSMLSADDQRFLEDVKRGRK